MRNTTKLKQVLLKYNVDLSMDDDECMQLTIIDKMTSEMETFSNPSYSHLISKAYSFMMKQLKELPGRQGSGEKRRDILS